VRKKQQEKWDLFGFDVDERLNLMWYFISPHSFHTPLERKWLMRTNTQIGQMFSWPKDVIHSPPPRSSGGEGCGTTF
jgi:hypothetical protein